MCKIKVKSQDYSDIQDKARIRAVINILDNIVPANSSIIKEGKFRELMNILYSWDEEYFAKIETYEE